MSLERWGTVLSKPAFGLNFVGREVISRGLRV